MGAKKKATSKGRVSALASLSLADLAKKAKKDGYAVFHECERRLAKDGASAPLTKVAKAAAGAIEDWLLGDTTTHSRFMEFGSEFDVRIYVDDEMEEGVYQAVELLAARVAKFEE